MTLEELLERHFSDAYKREMDQDESVWRTLPFFGASLALSATLIGYGASNLRPLNSETVSAPLVTEYALLFLSAGTLLWALICLWASVHTRRYRQLPFETETLRYLREVRDQSQQGGKTAADADDESVQVARKYLNEELAEATTHNRKANKQRLKFRSLSVRGFFIAWSFAILLAGTVFVSEKFGGHAHVTETSGPIDDTRSRSSTTSTATSRGTTATSGTATTTTGTAKAPVP